jgi:photosystem II stability/assembly factor-like uncharacterized protein
MKIILSLFTLLFAAQFTSAQWIKQTVNTTASLRGLSVVNTKIVWASGTGGTFLRTVDGGTTWKVGAVAGAEKLDFRDVEAFDAKTAYVLSIGNGEDSRIYKTMDGGETWKLQFKNTNTKAFFDAIACWDKANCIAMSDPVDGHYLLISTTDGGKSWKPLVGNKMPAAKDGEAAFAASGTCLITQGKNNAFIVSGGNDARVFRSTDRGKTWSVADTPIAKGTAGSGIFSIAMFDAKNGAIAGGNYEKPEQNTNSLALTSDGGKTWKLHAGLSGYRSSMAYVDRRTLVAVGTNGTDVSLEGGTTWKKISEMNLNAVKARGRNFTWAVGPGGLIVKQAQNGRRDQRPPQTVSRTTGHRPLANVTAVTLSQNEIKVGCQEPGKPASDRNIVQVAVTATELEEMKYIYHVTAGKIIGEGPNVGWDLSDAKPGTYTITTGISQPIFGGTRWEGLGKTITKVIVVSECVNRN